MKKRFVLVFMGIYVLFGMNLVHAGEKAPQAVVDLALSKLAAHGRDQVIVDAVRHKNELAQTLVEIQMMDKKWRAHPGIADYMQALMDSGCANHLRQIQGSAPYFAEIFVMDNQGANVAMTDKTSDYWQGDEAKFKKSYSDGKGAVFVDDVEFDDSVQTYTVQVSVPVKDGGETIGAITFGIDVDKL